MRIIKAISSRSTILTNKPLFTFSNSQLYNPYTRQFLSSKHYLTQDEIYTKVINTTLAHKKWKATPLKTRVDLVSKLTQSILADKNVLRHQIASEIGKSYSDIDEEFYRIQNVSDGLFQSGWKALQPQVVQTSGQNVKKIVFEPVGLAMIFPYFSQPLFDSLINLIPCLISGNGALIKPSDFNHFLGPYLQAKTSQITGIQDLVSQIFISPKQLPLMSKFRSLKKVLYSGSPQSAKHIFQTLIENRFIDCNLFFGGKDAAFVDKTADLSFAARQIVKYAFYNNGQSYDCISRVYIDEEIEDQFIELMRNQIQKLYFGNPMSPSTQLGPLCGPESAITAQQYINQSIAEGARCEIGGLITNDGVEEGIFFEPTLLTNCTNDMFVVQNQLHAPVLCTISATIQTMAQEINETQYGVGLRIFTKEEQKYNKIVDKLELGRIAFNSGNLFVKNVPIEGWKKSGKGKLLSQFAYTQFSIPKSYNITSLL